MDANSKIAIVGCGTMGSGMARILSSRYPLILCDRNFEKVKKLAEELNAQYVTEIVDAVQDADVIILAIKPQDIELASKDMMGKFRDGKSLISILAGISTKSLKLHLGNVSVLRAMPNLASLYGKGVVGLIDNPDLTADKRKGFEDIFSLFGHIYWIPESRADSFTALTACGPAFVYVIVESVVDAGIALGFTPEKAKELALQMIEGAVETLVRTGKHPGELKWDSTSPAGSTIAGIKQMEDESVRSGIINTFLAAYERLQDFSQS